MKTKTDLEKFVELYRSFGIECVVKNEQNVFNPGNQEIILGETFDDNCTISDKFNGYAMFFSTVLFDASGKFVSQGFWE